MREQDEESKSCDRFITTEGDCGAMKIVILMTVFESLAVMLAFLYFYYRRSQSRKRALVPCRPHVEQAQAKVVLPLGDYSERSLFK